jgi:hypothetical protein
VSLAPQKLTRGCIVRQRTQKQTCSRSSASSAPSPTCTASRTLLAASVDSPAKSAFLEMTVRCQELKLTVALMRKGFHPLHVVKQVQAEYHDAVADTYRAYTRFLEPGTEQELAQRVAVAVAMAASCRACAAELVENLAKTPFVVSIGGLNAGGIGTRIE